MATKDILLYENGNGGEIALSGNDILLGEQLYQQVYLCLFGGNVEAVTRGDEPAGLIRNDWWGNALFFPNTKSKQFNSTTEKALLENALTSKGRVNIIQAVENDLKYFKSVADISVDAAVTGANKLAISVTMKQPGNTVVLNMIWDGAKGEVIMERVV